jgi:hypothetical protein
MLSFLFGTKLKPLNYREAAPFTDPVAQAAYINQGIPMGSVAGGTGQMVWETYNALNPAFIQEQSAEIASVLGRGHFPNYLPVQQVLSAKEAQRVGSI